MKRTPLWVFVAGAGVQLAALWLCTWAMERWVRPQAKAEPPREPFEFPPPVDADVEAAEATAAEPAAASEPARVPEPDRVPEPAAVPEPPPGVPPAPEPERDLLLTQSEPLPAEPALPTATAQGGGPRLGPPPAPEPGLPGGEPLPLQRVAVGEPPRFVVADDPDGETQVLRGRIGEGSLVIGIAPDGNIRCVDTDGACYSGRSESARARLREVDGTRAFTVQIGVDAGGVLNASFTGGVHDGETIALTSLVEGGVS